MLALFTSFAGGGSDVLFHRKVLLAPDDFHWDVDNRRGGPEPLPESCPVVVEAPG